MRIPTHALVIAALFVAAAPAHAQVSFGLAGGATFYEINASGDESANVRLTDKLEPVFGVVLAADLSPSFQIAPEVLFAMKGTRIEADGGNVDIDLRYLEVPVLFRYRPAAPSGARWLHLMAGPYAAWLLGQDAEGGGTAAPLSDDMFGGFDLGWVVGVGVGGDHARLDFRYSGGFTNIDQDGAFGSGITQADDVTFRNRGFSLLGSVLF